MIHSGWSGLFNGNWVGCWKGVFKGVVERLFLLSPRPLGENTISLARFTFQIGIHFHLSAARISNIPRCLNSDQNNDASKARWLRCAHVRGCSPRQEVIT